MVPLGDLKGVLFDGSESFNSYSFLPCKKCFDVTIAKSKNQVKIAILDITF